MPVNIKELIDNGYIVICDTNVYLHIYRFSPEFSDFALRCMQAIQSGIIMPSTVRYEFLKHYRGYFSKMEKRVQNVGDDTKKQISNAARKVLNLCDNLQSLQYPDIEELRADLSQKFDELMAIPEAFFEDRTILDLIANPWKGQDPVYNLVELIINDSRVMTSVTQEEIYQICEEGERRYKTDPQTPPGFKDVFTFRIEADATSFDYWGRDDETKQILLGPAGAHNFEGKIQVEVIREADMYLDFEGDDGFEKATIIDGKLKETNFQPLFETDDDEYVEGAYNICPDCGCKINFENDGGNGFCVNCAPNH